MISIDALSNVIYRRMVRDPSRRYLTLEQVQWSALATFKSLSR